MSVQCPQQTSSTIRSVQDCSWLLVIRSIASSLQGLGWPLKCEVVCPSCDAILHMSPCRVDDKPKDIFGIREGGADAAPQESGVGSSATEMDMS